MQRVCAKWSSVACPAVQGFSTLSRKQDDVRKKKKVTDRKMCVLIFYRKIF